ncbi:MAG: SRPBCC family protein, partial [Deltaproteobacteria bacterium]|nr:SRPBCC family protein [Deltaproteobacteria bacterium]
RFQVAAPIERVWRFVMDPHQVVTCLPGATLLEVVDERTFVGQVKVKVGAVSASYKGKIQLTEVDEATYRVQMAAEGKETSGGTAKGTMCSHLKALPDGGTEVVAEASVDLTGRLMQVGRGMIQGVAHQIFLQFVTATRERLEGEAAAAAASAATAASAPAVTPDGATPAVTPAQVAPTATRGDDSIRILPILFRALWEGIRRFFRRLLGHGAA